MRIFFTSLFVLVLFSAVTAQNTLKQKFDNDSDHINSLLAEASELGYSCSQKVLFKEKTREAFRYYDERYDYYLSLGDDSPLYKEFQIDKRSFLDYYLKDNLYKRIAAFTEKGDKYIILCGYLANDDERRQVIAVYDSYKQLEDYYNSLKNDMIMHSSEIASRMPNEISCKELNVVAAKYDVAIATFKGHIETVNKMFYALPENFQNLETYYGSKTNTPNENSYIEYKSRFNGLIRGKFLFFDKYKGFRTELSSREMNYDHSIQYNKINSNYLKRNIENYLEQKKCN